MKIPKVVLLTVLLALSAILPAMARTPIQPVDHVDLSHYMGRWYVIGFIPTDYGKDATNMVETYRLMKNGDICTSLWFRNGGVQGEVKTKHDIASVKPDTGHAEWAVHVFWFIHAQYIVAWLAPDYSQVIVARDKRDYAWLMARKPHVSDADYQAMRKRVKAMGYDISKLRRVPQQWPSEGPLPDFEQSCD